MKKFFRKILLLPLIIIFVGAAFPIPILNSLLYFIFPAEFLLLIMILLFAAYIYTSKALKNKNSKLRTSTFYRKRTGELIQQNNTIRTNNRRIQESRHFIQDIQNELTRLGVFDRIPKQYTTYKAAVKMFTYLNNFRADTLKEAINLFEQEEHQERMERKQEAILMTAERAAVEARAANMNSAIAASRAASAERHSKMAAENAKKGVTVRVQRY